MSQEQIEAKKEAILEAVIDFFDSGNMDTEAEVVLEMAGIKSDDFEALAEDMPDGTTAQAHILVTALQSIMASTSVL